MKILAALALSLAAASCSSVADRTDWVDYGDDPMQNPQYMADWMAAGAPGPQHAALAKRAGSWSVEGKMWMEPGGEPMPMKATARTEVLLGGRYIIEEFKSDFMGMPFEGRLVQGYDNLAGNYWSLWVDSTSTGPWMSRGTETGPGRIEFHGTARDVMTPEGRPTRMTITENGDGSFTMKMFDTTRDGGEFQSMELRYARG